MTADVPSTLLVIGLLTTPINTTGISLNEYWAWVRYLNSLTSDPDMRITDDFASLDSHQKTILSDDFGIGIPMQWLAQNMQLQAVADGRYFIDRVAASVGAMAVKTSKRGPNKAPDFVARDTSGIWHIIECKGTQGGDRYRDRQLNGALAQKSTITFPAGYSGQRLACGVTLAGSNKVDGTNLRILDPPERKIARLELSPSQLDEAVDTASRAMVAAALKASGFHDTASAIASPLGRAPSARKGSERSQGERNRRDYVEARAARADAEILDATKRTAFSSAGQTFVGREVRFNLPRPLMVDGHEVLSVRIQQGINQQFMNDLRGELSNAAAESPKLSARPDSEKPISLSHDGDGAELVVGSMFLSRLTLEST